MYSPPGQKPLFNSPQIQQAWLDALANPTAVAALLEAFQRTGSPVIAGSPPRSVPPEMTPSNWVGTGPPPVRHAQVAPAKLNPLPVSDPQTKPQNCDPEAVGVEAGSADGLAMGQIRGQEPPAVRPCQPLYEGGAAAGPPLNCLPTGSEERQETRVEHCSETLREVHFEALESPAPTPVREPSEPPSIHPSKTTQAHRPWEHSTGPKTVEGKRRSAQNGKARQTGVLSVRQLQVYQKDQKRLLKTLDWALKFLRSVNAQLR